MGNFAPAIDTMHPGKETVWMENGVPSHQLTENQ